MVGSSSKQAHSLLHDPRLLQNLIKAEKGARDSFVDWTSYTTSAAEALGTYALTGCRTEHHSISGVIQNLSGLLGECSEAQHAYSQVLSHYRSSLKELVERESDVRIIIRDRDILVNRLAKLSMKRPTSEAGRVSHQAKLDLAKAELAACEDTLRHDEGTLVSLKEAVLKEAFVERFKGLATLANAWSSSAATALEQLSTLSSTEKPVNLTTDIPHLSPQSNAGELSATFDTNSPDSPDTPRAFPSFPQTTVPDLPSIPITSETESADLDHQNKFYTNTSPQEIAQQRGHSLSSFPPIGPFPQQESRFHEHLQPSLAIEKESTEEGYESSDEEAFSGNLVVHEGGGVMLHSKSPVQKDTNGFAQSSSQNKATVESKANAARKSLPPTLSHATMPEHVEDKRHSLFIQTTNPSPTASELNRRHTLYAGSSQQNTPHDLQRNHSKQSPRFLTSFFKRERKTGGKGGNDGNDSDTGDTHAARFNILPSSSPKDSLSRKWETRTGNNLSKRYKDSSDEERAANYDSSDEDTSRLVAHTNDFSPHGTAARGKEASEKVNATSKSKQASTNGGIGSRIRRISSTTWRKSTASDRSGSKIDNVHAASPKIDSSQTTQSSKPITNSMEINSEERPPLPKKTENQKKGLLGFAWKRSKSSSQQPKLDQNHSDIGKPVEQPVFGSGSTAKAVGSHEALGNYPDGDKNASISRQSTKLKKRPGRSHTISDLGKLDSTPQSTMQIQSQSTMKASANAAASASADNLHQTKQKRKSVKQTAMKQVKRMSSLPSIIERSSQDRKRTTSQVDRRDSDSDNDRDTITTVSDRKIQLSRSYLDAQKMSRIDSGNRKNDSNSGDQSDAAYRTEGETDYEDALALEPTQTVSESEVWEDAKGEPLNSKDSIVSESTEDEHTLRFDASAGTGESNIILNPNANSQEKGKAKDEEGDVKSDGEVTAQDFQNPVHVSAEYKRVHQLTEKNVMNMNRTHEEKKDDTVEIDTSKLKNKMLAVMPRSAMSHGGSRSPASSTTTRGKTVRMAPDSKLDDAPSKNNHQQNPLLTSSSITKSTGLRSSSINKDYNHNKESSPSASGWTMRSGQGRVADSSDEEGNGDNYLQARIAMSRAESLLRPALHLPSKKRSTSSKSTKAAAGGGSVSKRKTSSSSVPPVPTLNNKPTRPAKQGSNKAGAGKTTKKNKNPHI